MTLLSINCFAQITYEQGYYINEDNQKINCLIKNIDWKNTPKAFEYKITEDSKPQKANINSVKEFEIFKVSKYIRKVVEIDRSPYKDLNSLDHNISPNFKVEQLFLKVLVEGKANLYAYQDENLRRYFYNKNDEATKQLIFKYFKTADNKVGENNRFKQQVRKNLTCSNMKTKIKDLTYDKKSLINFFVAYNQCNNSDFKNYDLGKKRKLFKISIRPRLTPSSLTVDQSSSFHFDTDFGKKWLFNFGVEGEFILPYHKNKWSIFMEPTFQDYQVEKISTTNQISGGEIKAMIDYNIIELPIGLRHYFFLNKRSKIFINVASIFNLPRASFIQFQRGDNSNLLALKVSMHKNFAFGMGFKLDDKFSLELRHQTTKNIFQGRYSLNSNFKSQSIILGYTIH